MHVNIVSSTVGPTAFQNASAEGLHGSSRPEPLARYAQQTSGSRLVTLQRAQHPARSSPHELLSMFLVKPSRTCIPQKGFRAAMIDRLEGTLCPSLTWPYYPQHRQWLTWGFFKLLGVSVLVSARFPGRRLEAPRA